VLLHQKAAESIIR